MSLDVYLKRKRWISYDEGKTLTEDNEEVFWANITHNLHIMAGKAGIYEALWHPEEINATKAKDIISIVEKGLADMRRRPSYYLMFDSPNGWGTYEDFVPWIERYLEALKKYPEAEIEVSR